MFETQTSLSNLIKAMREHRPPHEVLALREQFLKASRKQVVQSKTDRDIQRVIDDVMKRVPTGRKLNRDEVDSIARTIALRLKLGVEDALEVAYERAFKGGLEDVSSDLKIEFAEYPSRRTEERRLIRSAVREETFSGFTESFSKKVASILEEKFDKHVDPGRMVTELIDEVGWEARAKLERIVAGETWRVWEGARLWGYKQLEKKRGQKFLYAFGSKSDQKTCELCAEIMHRSKNGLELEELVDLVRKLSREHSPKWDPDRGGGFPLPHVFCRHRFYRLVSKQYGVVKSRLLDPLGG